MTPTKVQVHLSSYAASVPSRMFPTDSGHDVSVISRKQPRCKYSPWWERLSAGEVLFLIVFCKFLSLLHFWVAVTVFICFMVTFAGQKYDNVPHIADEPGKAHLFCTGLKFQFPEGMSAMLVARSSLHKQGYMLANSVGIIDNGYVGEVMVPLIKFDPDAPDLPLPYSVAQLIFHPTPPDVEFVELHTEPENTDRGEGGFGSTDLPTVPKEEDLPEIPKGKVDVSNQLADMMQLDPDDFPTKEQVFEFVENYIDDNCKITKNEMGDTAIVLDNKLARLIYPDHVTYQDDTLIKLTVDYGTFRRHIEEQHINEPQNNTPEYTHPCCPDSQSGCEGTYLSCDHCDSR